MALKLWMPYINDSLTMSVTEGEWLGTKGHQEMCQEVLWHGIFLVGNAPETRHVCAGDHHHVYGDGYAGAESNE